MSEELIEEKCGWCIWWDYDTDYISPGASMNITGSGYCHYDPPRQGDNGLGVYPMTRAKVDWCSHWKKRP